MDLTPYLSRLQGDLAVAAAAGGPDAADLADRLTAPLASSIRLVLLEALSTAAAEISLELDDATVDVRLRGSDPELIVTRTAPAPAPAPAPAAPPEVDDADAGGTARLSLRMPDRMKPRLEQAAEADGVSVNSWLVRVIGNALDGTPAPTQPVRRGGWVR